MDDALAKEIADLRRRAIPPDARIEIQALRDRIARIEAAATATTQPTEGAPPMDLDTAIANRLRPAEPKDRKTRDAENAAKFYSPTEEASFRAREKDPERYDRELAAMGGDLLSQSLALAGREAHIKLGRALPTPQED
jgi:hypothetical protein